MRIDLRLKPNETAFGVVVNPAKPPTVVKPRGPDGPTVTLDWERALDDQKRLRHCPVCGCPDLFKRKRVPQLTAPGRIPPSHPITSRSAAPSAGRTPRR